MEVRLTPSCRFPAFGELRRTDAVMRTGRYEMRREAQLILPNLYLGGYQSSRSIECLKGLGITHM